MTTELSKPRIVCAAMSKGGEIIISIRHFDVIATRTAFLFSDYWNMDKFYWADAEQGFVDQHGRFYTREEAWLIASENNQIIRRVGGDMSPDGIGRLYSENLY